MTLVQARNVLVITFQLGEWQQYSHSRATRCLNDKCQSWQQKASDGHASVADFSALSRCYQQLWQQHKGGFNTLRNFKKFRNA